MGTPALSREKSDLARRSVAMITKEAVGSPKVPHQLKNFSVGRGSNLLLKRFLDVRYLLTRPPLDLILLSLKVV